MSTLQDIESAADSLLPAEKQELIYFLLTRLRGSSEEWPVPRDIPKEKIEAWIADDETGYRSYIARA